MNKMKKGENHIDPGNDPGNSKIGVRASRRELNKTKNEFVIKTTLNNSLRHQENSDVNSKIIGSILNRVEEMSKGCQRLSLAMNLFIKESCNKKNPLDIEIPKFLTEKNTTFARQMVLGLDKTVKPNMIVKNFLDRNEHLLPKKQKRFLGDSNTTVRASEQYLTNYKTYLETTFEKKQMAFLRVWCQRHELQEDLRIIRYLINGWEINRDYVQCSKVSSLIDFQRKLLNIEKDSYVCKNWISKNYEKVIVYYSVLSKYLLKHTYKGMVSAPVCRMKNMFIHIDTDVFHGIMNETKILDVSLENLRLDKSLHWDTIFDTNKFLTRNQRLSNNFTYTIETDGVSVCIHYRRPNLKKSTTDPYRVDPKLKKSNYRVIGQDPGRVSLFSGAEHLENGKWKKYRLTKSCYYEESGIKESNRKSNKWNLHIKDELEQLSMHSTKTTIGEFRSYMKTIKDNYKIFWNEYLNKKWSKQRLSVYSGKKRVFDKFFKSLDDGSGKKLVIAYGDAGFSSTSKYEVSSPTTRVLKETKKWYKVVMVDEFRTTQVHTSGIRLSKVVESTNELKRSVRGLLWCSSTNGSKFYVDRDFNSSQQMVNCFNLYPERPKGLNRSELTQTEPKAKYINKVSVEGETQLSESFTSLYCGNILPITV